MRKNILTVACATLLTMSNAYSNGLNPEEENFTQAFEAFRVQYKLAIPRVDQSLVNDSRDWSYRMRQSGQFRHGTTRENITEEVKAERRPCVLGSVRRAIEPCFRIQTLNHSVLDSLDSFGHFGHKSGRGNMLQSQRKQ